MDFIAEDVVWKVFSQLVVALAECHNRPLGGGRVLHRDLKPANILLDQSNSVKLGDFGLARILNENSLFCRTHVGTPYYMSPEQVDEAKYDEKCDIWSCGCLLYELAALRPPFEASNHLSLALKIKSGKFDRLPLRYSEDLQHLIESMLNTNCVMRPTVSDLLNIPHVALRIKERKLRERHVVVKQREDEMRIKEELLQRLEEELRIRAMK